MTTKITVEALCSDDKEVVISIIDEGEEIDEIALQNGDIETFYVFDEREFSAKEQEKE